MGAACEKERNPNARGPSWRGTQAAAAPGPDEGPPSRGCRSECNRDVAAAGLQCLCAADGANDVDTPVLGPTDVAAAAGYRRGFLARFQGAGGAGESAGDRRRREAAQTRLQAAYYWEHEVAESVEGATGCTVAPPGTASDAAATATCDLAPEPALSPFDRRLRALMLNDEAGLRSSDSHSHAADAADPGVLVLTPRCSRPVPRVQGRLLTPPQFANSEAVLRGDPDATAAAAPGGVLVPRRLVNAAPRSSYPVSRVQGSLLDSPQFTKGKDRAPSQSPTRESRLL